MSDSYYYYSPALFSKPSRELNNAVITRLQNRGFGPIRRMPEDISNDNPRLPTALFMFDPSFEYATYAAYQNGLCKTIALVEWNDEGLFPPYGIIKFARRQGIMGFNADVTCVHDFIMNVPPAPIRERPTLTQRIRELIP